MTDFSIDVKTGVRFASVLQATAQGLRFDGCSIGIDAASGTSGMLSLIDSSATNTSAVISAAAVSSTVAGSLLLENVAVDSSVAAVSLYAIKRIRAESRQGMRKAIH